MANARKKVQLTPEGEALRREALSRADDAQAQYEESRGVRQPGRRGSTSATEALRRSGGSSGALMP